MGAPDLFEPITIALVALGLCILALILMLIILIRQTRMLRRYRGLLNGPTGSDLEAILTQHQEQLRRAEESLSQMKDRLSATETQAKQMLQRVGVVRFDAFEDSGGDLSFAVAVLDGEENGFVLSSLYGRHESRTYAKPIHRAVSTYVLTNEEQKALQLARSQRS